MQASKIQDYGLLDFTAGAAYSGGDVIQHPSLLAGIVIADVANGDQGTCEVTGHFRVTKEENTSFAAGDDVFWDDTFNWATTTTSGGFFIGIASAAAAGADATVDVLLNQTSGAT